MDPIISLLTSLTESGILDHVSLLLIIIAFLLWVYRNVLTPLKKKVDTMASHDEIKAHVKEVDSIHMNAIHHLSKKLDGLLEELKKVEDYSKSNSRDIIELRRDIEQIKQILNQFQGHLMYNKKGSDFGNQELR